MWEAIQDNSRGGKQFMLASRDGPAGLFLNDLPGLSVLNSLPLARQIQAEAFACYSCLCGLKACCLPSHPSLFLPFTLDPPLYLSHYQTLLGFCSVWSVLRLGAFKVVYLGRWPPSDMLSWGQPLTPLCTPGTPSRLLVCGLGSSLHFS